ARLRHLPHPQLPPPRDRDLSRPRIAAEDRCGTGETPRRRQRGRARTHLPSPVHVLLTLLRRWRFRHPPAPRPKCSVLRAVQRPGRAFLWASKGSHYVKSGERFAIYIWRDGPRAIRIEVTQADVEKDNVKGEKRYYIPESIQEADDALIVKLAFRKLDA